MPAKPNLSGLLRDRVTVTSNTAGKDGDTVTTVRSQWCRIEPVSGREIEVAASQGNAVSHRITFRISPQVLASQVVTDAAGVKYRLEYVKQIRRSHQEAYAQVLDQ